MSALGFVWRVVRFIFSSSIYLSLTLVFSVMSYLYYQEWYGPSALETLLNVPLKKKLRCNLTVSQLKKFDGNHGAGRILLAVNGQIFDVTSAKNIYGKYGECKLMAGRDISRTLGTRTFQIYDDSEYYGVSDLSASEIERMEQWHHFYETHYRLVGKLLPYCSEEKLGRLTTDAGTGTDPYNSFDSDSHDGTDTSKTSVIAHNSENCNVYSLVKEQNCQWLKNQSRQ